MKILISPEYLTELDIKKIEEKFNAKYVCETCIKYANGWRDEPSLIFYSEEAHPQGSNWFAVSRQGDQYVISNAKESIDVPMVGVVADNGDVIYSRYRHDMRSSPDGSVWIDGGRDYTRCAGRKNMVMLEAKNGNLEIAENLTIDEG